MATAGKPRILGIEGLGDFAHNVLERVAGEAARRTADDPDVGEITFDIDIVVTSRPGDEPCCVCYRVGEGGRVCAGWCC